MNRFPISSGVRTDCEDLLRKFQATDSVRFEMFCKVWNDMDFGAILSLHESEKEMMQYMEECFLIALSFCHPLQQFQNRTGGLYLLYAFFFKQRCRFKIKIRVTVQQWKGLLEYIETAKEQNHHDINFIFQTLRLKHAFNFVSHPRELAPFYRDIGSTEMENSYTLHSTLKEIVEDGYVDQIDYLHKRYTKMKNQIITDGSLNAVSASDDVVATARRFFKEYQEKYASKFNTTKRKEKKEEVDDDDDDDEEEEESIGTRRAQLKHNLFKNVAKTKKSRRHRTVELDETSPPKTKETAAMLFKQMDTNESMEEDESGEENVQPSCSKTLSATETMDVEQEDMQNDVVETPATSDDLSMPILS